MKLQLFFCALLLFIVFGDEGKKAEVPTPPLEAKRPETPRERWRPDEVDNVHRKAVRIASSELVQKMSKEERLKYTEKVYKLADDDRLMMELEHFVSLSDADKVRLITLAQEYGDEGGPTITPQPKRKPHSAEHVDRAMQEHEALKKRIADGTAHFHELPWTEREKIHIGHEALRREEKEKINGMGPTARKAHYEQTAKERSDLEMWGLIRNRKAVDKYNALDEHERTALKTFLFGKTRDEL